jgi:hypothetical protein
MYLQCIHYGQEGKRAVFVSSQTKTISDCHWGPLVPIDCIIPENAMHRILLTLSALLAACTPSPQKAAMPSPSSETVLHDSMPSGPDADSPAAATGRRILSAAFVRVGPDGQLTVELQNGRVLVLRNVTMGPTDYCGVQIVGDPAKAKFCGGYAEVVAARPGGAPTTDLTEGAVSKPIEPARGAVKEQ